MEDSTAISEYSEQQKLADDLTVEAREIVRRHETGFGRLGVILRTMQDDELWGIVPEPGTHHTYRSFSHWVKGIGSRSESYCWAALKAARELCDLKDEDLSQMGHDNVQTMIQIPQSMRPAVAQAAKELKPEHFVSHVDRQFPSLHLEQRKAMRIRPSESTAGRIKDALDEARHRGAQTDSAAWESIAEAALEWWAHMDRVNVIARGTPATMRVN